YMPRGAMWRLGPEGPGAPLTIHRGRGRLPPPRRRALGAPPPLTPAPTPPPMGEASRAHQNQPGDVRVEVKKRGQVSTVTYSYNPLDAVGWHGDLAPVRLNVRDLRPVSSHRYHLPPSVHTTFVSERFVVCTFAPRPF